MSKRKPALVCAGDRGAYRLNILLTARTECFWQLNDLQFVNYRAAQDIANAINANVKKQRKTT